VYFLVSTGRSYFSACSRFGVERVPRNLAEFKEDGPSNQTLHQPSLTANAPKEWWLENDPLLLGPGNFFQGRTVKLWGVANGWKMILCMQTACVQMPFW